MVHNQPELLRVDAPSFVDSRTSGTPATAPTDPPILVIHETEQTPSPTAAPTFCCIAKRVPNWNGRCWGALTEEDCNGVLPAGKRCAWDDSQCRSEQTCLLRGKGCSSNQECCSTRCRSDTSQCR